MLIPPALPCPAHPAQAGDKCEEIAQLRSAAAAALAARVEAEAATTAAQAAAGDAASALSRAEHKLVLLSKERDGLKGILASYDEEYLNQHGGWQPRFALLGKHDSCSGPHAGPAEAAT